ncbi:MAG: hypothetical protein LBD29_01280 [Treponema sp.]|jgi:hypothetical protein|nr:hypothetical protein [Treponema sp.]
MNKHINFEDNIFILNVRVRMIQDLLLLEADPELFLKKTMDDIDFIDDALGMLLDDLIENIHLIERNELFDHLSVIEEEFAGVLGLFLNGNGTISAVRFPALREKIVFLRTHSLTRKQTIDNSRKQTEGVIMEPLVSSAELNELLKEY